jgi:hypothetical protein
VTSHVFLLFQLWRRLAISRNNGSVCIIKPVTGNGTAVHTELLMLYKWYGLLATRQDREYGRHDAEEKEGLCVRDYIPRAVFLLLTGDHQSTELGHHLHKAQHDFLSAYIYLSIHPSNHSSSIIPSNNGICPTLMKLYEVCTNCYKTFNYDFIGLITY